MTERAPYYLTITVPIGAVEALGPLGWELETLTADGRAIVRKPATPRYLGALVLDQLGREQDERTMRRRRSERRNRQTATPKESNSYAEQQEDDRSEEEDQPGDDEPGARRPDDAGEDLARRHQRDAHDAAA